MLRAYFDAGLQKKPRPVFYVSGYVGFPGDWQVFNRKWRQLLRQNDLPYFHMTDYVARQEHYKGWSEPKRLAVMKRIVALASETARLGMGATLLLDDFERLTDDDKEVIPDHPYGLCLIACIGKTARTLHRQGISDHVDYVFELGDAGQGSARIAVEELFASPTKRRQFSFNSLSFAPKETFPGLQLADVLAFETGRYMPLALGWATSPERKCFQALRERNEHYTMLFDSEELTKMAAKHRQRRDAAR
jgi:hypothetical protein